MTIKGRVVGLLKSIFTPRPKLSIREWAKQNIRLSTKESGDFPGPYDPDLNPLPTDIWEVIKGDYGRFNRIIICKSSQTGVTLVLLIYICYYVSYVCRNFLYVIDKIEEMRRISKERLQPMLKMCKAAKGRITENEDDMANLTLSLKGLVGYLCGSNSLGSLANKSVGLAIFDETDTYKNKSATSVGNERGKKQSAFLSIELSKPEDYEDNITQQWLKGTRHKHFFPCPHCGTRQTVEFERIIYSHCKDILGGWDYDRMAREIYLRCINDDCVQHSYGQHAASQELLPKEILPGLPAEQKGGKIYEEWKPWMIRRRDFRATNDGKDKVKPVPGVFSCTLDDLMSTFPTATWPALVQEWITAIENNDEEAKKTFLRGRLARGWKQKSVEVKDADIYRMVAPYRRGQCPVEPALVLMSCDVQQVVRKWVKRAYMFNGDSYVIDWGECLSFEELINIADEPVEILKWNDDTPVEMRINPTVMRGLIDEGYIQKDVRDFVVSTRLGFDDNNMPIYRFCSVWGQPGMRTRSQRDIVWPRAGAAPNTTHAGWPIWAYRFSDDNFKDHLYNKIFGGFKDIEAALKEGKLPPPVPRVWFPVDINEDRGFVSELCQEKRVFNERSKQWEWIDPKGKNDFGDGMKMCDVAWYVVGPAVAIQRARAQAEREKAKALAAAAN